MSVHVSETGVVKGACPQDGPDTCAFLYHVEDGKLVEVTGDPDHPMTRRGLCVKLKDFAEHHYNPSRLLFPMRRTGVKGSGQLIAARGSVHGRQRTVHYRYGALRRRSPSRHDCRPSNTTSWSRGVTST